MTRLKVAGRKPFWTRFAQTRGAGPLLLLLSRYLTNIVGPLVSFLVIRHLGQESYGYYASATAVVALFNGIPEFGLQQAALEAFAAGRSNLGEVTRCVLRLGFAFSLAAYSIVAFWMTLGEYDWLVVRLALLTAFTYFQTPLLTAVTVRLQASGLFGRIAFWNFAWFTAKWGGTLVALLTQAGVEGVVLWPVVTSWAVVLVMSVWEGAVASTGPIVDRRKGSPVISLRSFFARAWRYGLASSLYQLYHRADSALLSLMRNPIEVGYYAASFRVVELFTTFSGIMFNQILYPKYFRWFKVNPLRVQLYYRLVSKGLLGVGLTVSVLLTLFAREVIVLIIGTEAEAAALMLGLMAWAIPGRFLAASADALLTTGELVEKKLRLYTLGAAINIAMNLVLIPVLGALGSSGAIVAGEIVVAALCVRTARKALEMHPWTTVQQVLLSGALVVLGLLATGWSSAALIQRISLGIVMIAAGAAYTASVLAPEERRELRRLLRES